MLDVVVHVSLVHHGRSARIERFESAPHRQQKRRSSTTDSDEPAPAKVSSKIHVQTRHLPK